MVDSEIAKLALEDGTVFTGTSFGAAGTSEAEVVFNTSMTGYQEIMTDPSYCGQIVTMTYPLIGNYGICAEDVESGKIQVAGFVVREPARLYSNFRAERSLQDYLRENNIIGLSEVDTRAITRRLRIKGAMKGILSTKILDDRELVARARASAGLVGRDLVCQVTRPAATGWDKGFESAFAGPVSNRNNLPDSSDSGVRSRIIAFDCGLKDNIARNLVEMGFEVIIMPAGASVEDIINLQPDGIFVSNGPGDPEPIKYTIDSLRRLIEREIPIFGICLGLQLICQALGGKTYKLKFGHRGANHPVKNLDTGRVEITAQNHGFAVDIDSLDADSIRITHVNLNDNTLEGIAHRQLPLFAVQYHPEASPGPHDAAYLFRSFREMVRSPQPARFR